MFPIVDPGKQPAWARPRSPSGISIGRVSLLRREDRKAGKVAAIEAAESRRNRRYFYRSSGGAGAPSRSRVLTERPSRLDHRLARPGDPGESVSALGQWSRCG